MVTITQYADGKATPIIDRDTVEDAETFLDGLSGKYWGLPGFLAKREPGQLIIKTRVIGAAGWTITSMYKIEDAA